MTVYPSNAAQTLSSAHRHTLEVSSGVDLDVVEERGYRTVRSRADLLDFKKYQRRASANAPALRVPMYSPDGITRLSQLRPDNPRKDKKGKTIKYEAAGGAEAIIDVHPRMRDEARAGGGDLWITEGLKKADCLTSRGLCAIGLIGVWNWQRSGEMLPCWDHIRLRGRRVYIVFDSDVMEKEGVQLALERLVEALEKRGAEVLVVFLPHESEEKTGVDDYLVAGGTASELKMLARKFEPADFGRIRLSKDERLRAAVEELERRFWSEEWKGMGGHSDRDLALKLIEAARRHGKIAGGRLRVVKSWGALELEAKVSSRTLAKALNRLEERGFCQRDNEGREDGKAGAFILRAGVNQYGGINAGGEKATSLLQAYDQSGLHLRAPRLRWSSPARKRRRGFISGTRRPRQGPPPVSRPAVKRLGKIRCAILDVLDVAGGSATLQEIADVLHRKRPRDLRRRTLPMLEESGIVTMDGDQVSLADNWLEALEEQRELGGEIEAEEKAIFDLARKRKAYHGRDQVKPSRHFVNAGADGHIEDLRRVGGDLSPEDAEVLDAIEAFEGKNGRGSFRWDGASCKKMFYSGPIRGHWPDGDQLRRIREHVEARSMRKAA